MSIFIPLRTHTHTPIIYWSICGKFEINTYTNVFELVSTTSMKQISMRINTNTGKSIWFNENWSIIIAIYVSVYAIFLVQISRNRGVGFCLMGFSRKWRWQCDHEHFFFHAWFFHFHLLCFDFILKFISFCFE